MSTVVAPRSPRSRGPQLLALALVGTACEVAGADPALPRATGAAVRGGPSVAPAECYERTPVPPLGIPAEDGQHFVDLDEQGRVLLDAVPEWKAHKVGRSMRTAFLWAGDQARPLRVDGFLQTRGQDINERGEVLVVASRAAGLEPGWTDAFIWQDGEVRAWIPAPKGHTFWGGRINELGHVALTAELDADRHFSERVRVMLWRDGGLSELGRGIVSDFADDADEIAAFDPVTGEALLWRGAERVPLAPLCRPPDEFNLFGGVLLGPREGDDLIATLACPEGSRTAVWRGGEPRELPTLDGLVLHVTGRNARGDVVGSLRSDFFGPYDEQVPAMWRDGRLIALPLPPGVDWGEVGAVNDGGVFIGGYFTDEQASHFVGGVEGAALLPLPESWRSSLGPGGINNRGDVAGSVSGDNDTSMRTYLWRPVACDAGGAGM